MDGDDRDELAARLFALLTAMFEDAAVLAVEGQGGSLSVDCRLELAGSIRGTASDATTLADAIAVFL